MNEIKLEEKKCKDENCEKLFTQYKSTDKYCCYACRIKNQKPKIIKQKPIKKEFQKVNCINENCKNTFVKQRSTDKYCSFNCQPKKERKVLLTIKKEVKEKPCNNKNCENVFIQYNSTDKYCSLTCEIKDLKSKVEVYESFKTRQIKIKKRELSLFEKEFNKTKNEIKERLISENGALICEKCGTRNSIQFSTHHIIFRSELPKHNELNNKKNLIHLCYDCHELFHKKKNSRNYLIKERNLTELFGKIWGYFPEDEK